MNNIIVHIPHSSLKLPLMFFEDLKVSKKEILDYNNFMVDYKVNELVPKNIKKIIFPYSRLFCDVERFKDDSKEMMSKYGMGVIYQKNIDGKIIRSISDEYKMKVINNYYNWHHEKFTNMVTDVINKYNSCLIIDLHSYGEEFVKKIWKDIETPDICLGVDNDFIGQDLILVTIKHFEEYGYSVLINKPYAGSIVPLDYYNAKDKRVKSLMIEINKKIYLDSDIIVNEEKFLKLKECLEIYLRKLQNFEKGCGK